MDREISPKEQKKRKIKKIMTVAIPLVIIFAGIILSISLMAPSMKRESLDFITVDKGTVETSADASGKVVPAYELIITSPVATRIMEIY